MKVANTQHIKLGQMLVVNYIVCCLSLLIQGTWQIHKLGSPVVWLMGISIGVLFVLSLWLYDRAIAATGLALSTTLMRLSAAIPTLASILVFSEKASIFQTVGLVVAFACLPLASNEPLRLRQMGKDILGGMHWGLLLFIVAGVTDFVFKVQVELEPDADPNGFMMLIFGTALILTLPQLFKGPRPSKQCILWGFTLGASNVLTTFFKILALAIVPGSIAFPTMGIGVIALTAVASLLIWKEKLRPANYLFLALGCLAVLLINFS
jgi:drug/metabolite transporter (DMT)-like permease